MPLIKTFIDNFIRKTKKFNESLINKCDELTTIRKKKIRFNDLAFYMSQLIQNKNESSVTVASYMSNKDICDATPSAYKQKRNNISSEIFKRFSDEYLDYFYSNNNKKYKGKYRLMVVDGTHVYVDKCMKNELELKKGNQYIDMLISGLYDITNEIVVNLQTTNTKNERETFLQQFNYIKCDDIIVHDRGYFSYKLLNEIKNKDAYSVFRMKTNVECTKQLIKSGKNDMIYTINNEYTNNEDIKLRLIKYTVERKKDKETYYIATTLLNRDEFPIKEIKYIYKKRWDIETFFRHIKYDLSFDNFHTKTLNSIEQEIYIHQFVFIITRLFENLSIKANLFSKTNPNYKLNKNNSLKIVSKSIIYELFYGKTYISTIKKLVKGLIKHAIKIRPDRKFPLKRRVPGNKWVVEMIYYKLRAKLYNEFKQKFNNNSEYWIKKKSRTKNSNNNQNN